AQGRSGYDGANRLAVRAGSTPRRRVPGSLRAMPERREPRFDGAAWVLLLCGLLVALCVLNDDPSIAAPNLLGPPGTWLARELLGVVLTADFIVRGACVVLYHVCMTLSWLLAACAGQAEAWSAAWRKSAPAKPAARDEMFDIPIVHPASTKPAVSPEPAVE